MKLTKNFRQAIVKVKCEDCEFEVEDFQNGRAMAADHAKLYGHKVNVNTSLSGYYKGIE